jgi:hypothetical protein
MPLDLSKIAEPKTRWITLHQPLDGVELQIRHVGPRDMERFRQRMIRAGIMKSDPGVVINAGRDTAFFEGFAEAFICDWRGDIRATPDAKDCPAYTPAAGGMLLAYSSIAFEQVSKAVGEEADFFSVNGKGSTG